MPAVVLSTEAVHELGDELQAAPGAVRRQHGRWDVAGIIWNVMLVNAGSNRERIST